MELERAWGPNDWENGWRHRQPCLLKFRFRETRNVVKVSRGSVGLRVSQVDRGFGDNGNDLSRYISGRKCDSRLS